MQKVITMTAYRRPVYTRQVLAALAQCDGIEEWQFLPHVEPGHEEVIEEVRGFNACEKIVTLNATKQGLNRNTFQCVDHANTIKADMIVHLEDDTVPSPDALRYFEWAIREIVSQQYRARDGHHVSIVSGYNKPKSEPTQEQNHLCDTRPIWTPWGWGTDRTRLRWLITQWCFRNPKCFTCKFKSGFRATRREVFPVLSRIQNIGYDLGENGRSAEWYRSNHRTSWVAGEGYGEFRLLAT